MPLSRSLKIASIVADVSFLLIIVLVPGHPYEWMRDMDPGMKQLPEDPLRDLRLIGTSLFLVLAVGLHVARIKAAGNSVRRSGHILAIAMMSAAWFWKNWLNR